jgi:hypothetical protein
MIRITLRALGLLSLTSTLGLASHIVGGMTGFAVFSAENQVFNSHPAGGGTTTINGGLDAGSPFALNGAAITFNGGGTFVNPVAGSDITDFNTLSSAVGGLGGPDAGAWVGLLPGNYTFSAAPASLTLTVPGTYVFNYVGLGALTFSGVSMILGPHVGSDDVIWFSSQNVFVSNSTFAGVLVVDGVGAGATVEAVAGSTVVTGRVLSRQGVELVSWLGGDLSFENQVALPEPSSILLVLPVLAFGAFIRRRLTR